MTWLLGLIVLATLVPFDSPEGAQARENGADVVIVHGISDLGPVNLMVDGRIAFFGVTFSSQSDPIRLAAGSHDVGVELGTAGVAGGALVIGGSVTVDDATPLTVVLIGTAAEPRLLGYPVDLTSLDDAGARVRIVHGSPDSGPLDLALSGGDLLLPTVEFGAATDYADIDAGAYDFQLRYVGSETIALDLAGIELVAGEVTDLVAVGATVDGTLRIVTIEREDLEMPGGDGFWVSLREGSCDDPGDTKVEIEEALPADGELVGQLTERLVASAVGTVPSAFDALLADKMILVVSALEGEAPLACGEVGGRLSAEGALIVPLASADASEVVGMALLSPSAVDPAATDLSLYVVVGTDE